VYKKAKGFSTTTLKIVNRFSSKLAHSISDKSITTDSDWGCFRGCAISSSLAINP